MIRNTAKEVTGSAIITYGDREINFKDPFKWISMNDLIKEKCGIDFEKITDFEEAKKLADELYKANKEKPGSLQKDVITLAPEKEAFRNFVKTHQKQAQEAAERGETYDFKKEFAKVKGNSVPGVNSKGKLERYFSTTTNGYLHFILGNGLI